MFAARVLLCVLLVFGASFALIPFDDVKFKIFDDQSDSFESNIIASLQTTKNFFAKHEVSKGFDIAWALATAIPLVGQFSNLLPSICAILAKESDWNEKFSRTIANETRREIALERITWMEATMKTMRHKMNILNDTNPESDRDRKMVASIAHTDLAIMINYFSHRDSLFKKFPLIGAPPLIELAVIVAAFHPITQLLIPYEAKNPNIVCDIRDVVADYMPRVVDARLDKLSIKNDSHLNMYRSAIVTVKTLPFDSNGYNKQGMLTCDKSCEQSNGLVCIKDELNVDEYNAFDPVCLTDYPALVRYRVEEMFPVVLLNRLCGDQPPKTPTGYGWLTLKIKTVCAYGKDDGFPCETAPCAPYIELYINEQSVHQERIRPLNSDCVDANITYSSKRISKNSLIKIEVWDDDTTIFGIDRTLVQREYGNILSFWEDPFRNGSLVEWHTHKRPRQTFKQNSIETAVFWEDEFY